MTPNLFLATQTLFSPHKWFKSAPKGERAVRVQEQWDDPVPGVYEYIPGRGWYLIATNKDADAPPDQSDANSRPGSRDEHAAQVIKNSKKESKHMRNASMASVTRPEWEKSTVPVKPPLPVKYSKVLKRYLLATDYDNRKQQGRVQGSDGKYRSAGFFRLDDGIAWVQCWDDEGEFISGPYKLWCIDRETKEYRHMLKRDDPAYASSRQNSVFKEGSDKGRTSRCNSLRRRSQDSRSTQFRPGPGSASRDGFSVPSTRPGSIKASGASSSQLHTPNHGASRTGSAANSRRGSPRRALPGQAGGVNLEEAKERLRAMAREQAERSRSRANSDEEGKRGRGRERVGS